MSRVIHTGQALVDEVVRIPEFPRRGQNTVASSHDRYAGASSNVLVAAARSGAQCVQAGSVGIGPNGDLIRATFAREGVRISSPPVTGADTGICFVMVDPAAERTFVTTSGAERRISVESLDSAEPAPGDLVCVSGYTLLGVTREPLLRWLQRLASGIEVVFDPGAALASVDPGDIARVLARTTVWTSNAEEATERTGVRPIAGSTPALAARLPAGSTVVVRDGARGCVVHTGGVLHEVAGFPRHAVDTNGAGDTHTGILVAERSLGLGWVEAARRANAGAAIKVTRHGPDSAPGRAEIDEFLNRIAGDR